jgi:methionine-rich copper-binding protein CopC
MFRDNLGYRLTGLVMILVLLVTMLPWPVTVVRAASEPLFVSSTQDISSAARTSSTFSHTVAVGDDRLLLVVTSTRGDDSVSTVTYGGSGLTLAQATGSGGSTGQRVEVWYMVAPATGANDVVVTYSGSVNPDVISAMSYTGVDQTNPIGATNGAFGVSTGPSVSLTSTVADALIVGGVSSRGGDTDPYTPGTGTTERYDTATGTHNSSDDGATGGEESAATTGSYTFDFTQSVSDDWAIVAVEVKPTAGDVTAPTLSSTTPADEATGVAVNQNLIMVFDEGMAKGTGNILIKQTSDDATIQTIPVSSGNVTISTTSVTNDTVTIVHADFANAVGYYITLASGVLTDTATNPYAGISAKTDWNFTTIQADLTAPTLNSTTPADEATGVAVNQNLVMVFDEGMAKGTGDILIKRTADDTTFQTIDVTSGSVTLSMTSVTNDTVTITHTDFLNSVGYYVTMVSGVLTDDATPTPNAYAGISAKTVWNFTTAAAADTTPPTLDSTTPADEATGVAVNQNLIMVFDEGMAKGTGDILIKRTADDTTFQTIDVTSGSVTLSTTSVTNDTVTITHTDFLNSVGYHVTMVSGVLTDDATPTPNAYAGISAKTDWNFTTAAAADTTPPTLDSTTPADEATSVAINQNLIMVFDEGMAKGTGDILIKRTADDTTFQTIDVTSGSVTLSTTSVTNDTVTITHTDFLNNVGYYVTLVSGVLTDDATPTPNAYAGISAKTVWNFTTVAVVDTTPPTLNSTTPADEATGVAINQNLIMVFDEGMAKGTGNILIKQTSDDATIQTIPVSSGNVTLSTTSVTNDTVTIVHADFTNAIGYYITLASGVLTDDATPTPNAYAGISAKTDWNFTVVQSDVTAPTLSSTTPADDATSVAVNQNLIMVFDEGMAKGTGNILIKQTSDDATIQTIPVSSGNVTISTTSVTNDTVTIVHADFTNSIGYYITLASGVLTDDATPTPNAYAGISAKTDWNFTVISSVGAAPMYVSHTLSTSTAARTSATFSHTTPTGDDRLLVVIVGIRGDQSVSTVTYAGNSLTLAQATGSGASGGQRVEVWYRIAPTTGANNVVVTYAASVNPDNVSAMSYVNVDQTNPIGATNGAFGTSTAPSMILTSTVTDALIVGGVSARGGDTDPFTPGTGTTERYDVGSGTNKVADDGYAGGDEPADTITSYTFDFTQAVNDDWAIAAVELKPPQGSPDVSNTPGSYGFGIITESSTSSTGLTYFTLTNNSSFAVTVSISATDMTGTVDWTLSDTATPGVDTIGLKAGVEGGSYNIIVKKTAAYNILVSSLSPSGTQRWGLQILAPTTISDASSKSTTITLTAVAS